MISGKPVAADQLAQHGTIDRLADPGRLEEGIATELALYEGKSPAILGMIADLVHREARRTWGDRIHDMESQYLDKLLPHPDVEEGIYAFLEKRAPKWQDPEDRPDPREALDWKMN